MPRKSTVPEGMGGADRSEARERLSHEAPHDPDLLDNVTEAADSIPEKARREEPHPYDEE